MQFASFGIWEFRTNYNIQISTQPLFTRVNAQTTAKDKQDQNLSQLRIMKRAVATLAPRIANVRDNSEVADGPAIKEKHTRLDTRCNQTCKLAKREHAKHHQAGKYLKVCNAAQSSHRARVRRSVGGPHAVEVVPKMAHLTNVICQWLG